MRLDPDPYRLSFLVPQDGALARACDHFHARATACRLTVHAAGLVSISGPAREAVFDAASDFLRVLCAGLPPVSIAGLTVTDTGRDSWSIVVGADVVFSPTALAPFIAPACQILTRALTSIGGRT